MSNHSLSFEFFPPKTPQGDEKLMLTAKQLGTLKPDFFSVTFGAGGSTRTKTLATVLSIKKQTHIKTIPHLSCIGMSAPDMLALIEDYQDKGIQDLVVLRGDKPEGESTISDFQYASDLIRFIRAQTGHHFNIVAACYPEFHPESESATSDFEHFLDKARAGANAAITQYFYNQDAYFRLVEKVQKAKLNLPIIPGIMPILKVDRLVRFSQACGAEIPRWLAWELQDKADDEDYLKQWSVDFLSQMCDNLLRQGAPGLHFYTLNEAWASLTICRQINMNAARDYATKNLSPEPA